MAPAVRTWLAVLSIASASCGPGSPPGRYERIVLVTIDTLRADHLGCYGYVHGTSPFLDRLADEGVVFTRANATSSHTAPSHASIFTGLVPLQHRVLVNGDRLSPELPSMAQVFAGAGYRTAAFTSVGFVRRAATGFETFDAAGRQGRRTVERAMAWLDGLGPGQPFFLWVHLFDVHQAELRSAPQEHYAALREANALDPDAAYDYLAELHGLPDPPPGEPFPGIGWDHGDERPSLLTSRAEVLERIEHYDAQIAYVDAQIERLFDAVREVDPGAPSLWIVTADHGEGLGSHDYRGHGGHVYQAQLHVPLIFHASDGSLPPRRVDEVVSLVDLFPTLADVLADPPQLATEGASLWPRLLGETAPSEERAVFAQRRPLPALEDDAFVLLSGRHKYILHTGRDDEFYDLGSDPRELVDRISDASAERYRKLLTNKLDELGWTGAFPDEREVPPPEVLSELRALGYVR